MYLEELCQAAVGAKLELQNLTNVQKNEALKAVAETLIAESATIIEANAKDIDKGRENGMHPGLIDRLLLNEERIKGIAEGLYQIIQFEDPVSEVLEERELSAGLHLRKVRVPMGVIGIIYESRPNVTVDSFGLCFKSGNAVILKGGSDAINSNIAIVTCIKKALKSVGITENAILLIEKTDRETTTEFMKMNQYVDLLIPRGNAGLINAALKNSTIPIIETGTGNCHIFIDETADLDMAINIIINAKTQRIGVCNACESLVVHEKIKDAFLPLLNERLKEAHVEVRGDEITKGILSDCVLATDEDFAKEFLDYILSIKVVGNIDEAISHINRYSTKHSEAIITKDFTNADKFQRCIDSACVYVNASTRFTDGFVFGLGAEIGISTQKLHARGPMGLKELTTYKYLLNGNGAVR